MAILQHEMAQMSHEVYAQQKELSHLLLEIEKLKSRLEGVQPESAILTASEDIPPPHY
jgi:uncharacterized coiled-coil protein SlyX